MEAVHDEELQEHWALKELWMKELRHVAIGEDEGRQQGQWLGVLMEDLLRREDGLEEQHRALERHRLAALVQASKRWSTRTSSHSFANLHSSSSTGAKGVGSVEATAFGRAQVSD